MTRPVVVTEPGGGQRVGNVEFLARTVDTPLFTLGFVVLVPAGTPHAIANDGTVAVRILNVHAPGGFDRRIGLSRPSGAGAGVGSGGRRTTSGS